MSQIMRWWNHNGKKNPPFYVPFTSQLNNQKKKKKSHVNDLDYGWKFNWGKVGPPENEANKGQGAMNHWVIWWPKIRLEGQKFHFGK